MLAVLQHDFPEQLQPQRKRRGLIVIGEQALGLDAFNDGVEVIVVPDFQLQRRTLLGLALGVFQIFQRQTVTVSFHGAAPAANSEVHHYAVNRRAAPLAAGDARMRGS